MKRVVLASASPRRRELLKQVGVEFEVIPSAVEEDCSKKDPTELVEALARQKAEAVAGQLSGDFIVIGADTIVAMDGVLLGKPADAADAFQTLSRLQGRTHQVCSGVALLWRDGSRSGKRCFHVVTQVEVLPMTEQQIRAYIATGDCMDKAGAYGIQGCFAEHIRGIAGDYYNVVGLPVSRLMQELRPMLEGKLEEETAANRRR